MRDLLCTVGCVVWVATLGVLCVLLFMLALGVGYLFDLFTFTCYCWLILIVCLWLLALCLLRLVWFGFVFVFGCLLRCLLLVCLLFYFSLCSLVVVFRFGSVPCVCLFLGVVVIVCVLMVLFVCGFSCFPVLSGVSVLWWFSLWLIVFGCLCLLDLFSRFVLFCLFGLDCSVVIICCV